jgi:inorganic pyrophosphatase/exopolyphosphatase
VANGHKRLDQTSTTRKMLDEHMEQMVEVVDHHRQAHHEKHEGRKIIECVTVIMWEEPDGNETISVIGDDNLNPLELKGLLHDAIYAMAHEDEQVRR